MDTEKSIISLNQQKKYEELTNLVKNTNTEEVNKYNERDRHDSEISPK